MRFLKFYFKVYKNGMNETNNEMKIRIFDNLNDSDDDFLVVVVNVGFNDVDCVKLSKVFYFILYKLNRKLKMKLNNRLSA